MKREQIATISHTFLVMDHV